MAFIVPTNAYISVRNLKDQKLPHRTFDQNSKPSHAQAENLIRNVASEINAVLRQLGYSPPLTGTDDVRFLSEMNALGAAARIERAAIAVTGSGVSEAANDYNVMYEDRLEALRENKFQFETAGVTDLANADVNDELDSGGLRSEPIFTMDDPNDDRKF